LLTIISDNINADCVGMLHIIIPRSSGYGSRIDLVELVEKIKSLQREKSYKVSNEKLVKGIG